MLYFVCSLGKRRALPLLTLVAVGCVSLVLGFRSHGLVCFAAAVVLLVKGRSRRGRPPVFKAILAGGGLYALSELLPAALSSGIFGEAVRLRTVNQLEDSGPALLAGRVEPPLSIAAIWERPWFGWGNLGGVDHGALSRAAEIAYNLGMVPQDYLQFWVRRDGSVSVHSLLGKGWVEGGIVAAVMPLLLLVMFVTAILKAGESGLPL